MDFFHWTRQKGPLKSHGSFFKMSKSRESDTVGLMCLAGGRASKGLPRPSPRPLTDKREAHMMGGVVILYNP